MTEFDQVVAELAGLAARVEALEGAHAELLGRVAELEGEREGMSELERQYRAARRGREKG